MTPEPTGGYYREAGVIPFLQSYGYPAQDGTPDRLNFGGTYYMDTPASATGYTLTLAGFDPVRNKFDVQNGGLLLKATDEAETVIASWGFATLLTHWNRKHAKTVYVPSERRTHEGNYQYRYSPHLFLGQGTSFFRFLRAFHEGKVFYDPGIKVENLSVRPRTKRRSQFRIKAKDLAVLYDVWEEVTLSV